MARRQRGIRAARKGWKIVTLRTWRRRSRVRWECHGGAEKVCSILRPFALDLWGSCWADDDCLQGRPWPKIGRLKVRPGAAFQTLLGGLANVAGSPGTLHEDNLPGSEVRTLSQHRTNDITKHYLIQNSFAVNLLQYLPLVNIGQDLRRICRKDR